MYLVLVQPTIYSRHSLSLSLLPFDISFTRVPTSCTPHFEDTPLLSFSLVHIKWGGHQPPSKKADTKFSSLSMTLMDLLMKLNDERVSILAATKGRSCKVHVSCPGFVFVQFQRHHQYVSVNVIYKPFVYLPDPRLPCRCTDSQRQHHLVRPSTNAQAFHTR